VAASVLAEARREIGIREELDDAECERAGIVGAHEEVLMRHLSLIVFALFAVACGGSSSDFSKEEPPPISDRIRQVVIDKNRPSGFFGTGLEASLSERNISGLIVCGLTTNVCVETTVRDASQRDYRVFVAGDAVAEYEQDRHDVALKSMGMLFAKIVDTDAVTRAWQ